MAQALRRISEDSLLQAERAEEAILTSIIGLIANPERYPDRFPEDFMLQLTNEELDSLRSQIAISKKGRGGRRYAPFAFTEHDSNANNSSDQLPI